MTPQDTTPGLRERCDVCRQPASVWTVARGLDTARCRRCDALERDLAAHANSLFRLPDARSWTLPARVECPNCRGHWPAALAGEPCPGCAAPLPTAPSTTPGATP